MMPVCLEKSDTFYSRLVYFFVLNVHALQETVDGCFVTSCGSEKTFSNFNEPVKVTSRVYMVEYFYNRRKFICFWQV